MAKITVITTIESEGGYAIGSKIEEQSIQEPVTVETLKKFEAVIREGIGGIKSVG
jgi:hypothetical protein